MQKLINRHSRQRCPWHLLAGMIMFWGLWTGIPALFAANPIVTGYSDPALLEWGGKMYLAVGKDLSPQDKDFIMPYWSLFSSSNLVDWKLETHIDPAATFLGKGYNWCWAPDLISRDGKYYFYFSIHGEATGVLQADAPAGPYLDVLKRPLVPGPHHYDPTVFADDNGEAYLIYGRDGMLGTQLIHYQIARLGEDMISLAERPRDLLTTQPYGFGGAKVAPDHNYLHKHNGLYYLSCAGDYMTSTNIYGPYAKRRFTGQRGHTCFFDYQGQSYHAWEWTCDPYGNRKYRQVMLTYLHYKDNGDMLDDTNFLKGGAGYALGVANYDARWERIEAEWYFSKSGLEKRECPAGGFELQDIHEGDCVSYPNVRNLPAEARMSFQVSSANPGGGQIEVHADGPTGPLLGRCEVANTGSWKDYQTVAVTLNNAAGSTNLCLRFKGGAGDLLHLDWFSFSPPKSGEHRMNPMGVHDKRSKMQPGLERSLTCRLEGSGDGLLGKTVFITTGP